MTQETREDSDAVWRRDRLNKWAEDRGDLKWLNELRDAAGVVQKVKPVRCYISSEEGDAWVANTCLHSPDPKYVPAVAMPEDQVEGLLVALEMADRIELLRDELAANYARVRDEKASTETRLTAERSVRDIRETIRATRARLRTSIDFLVDVLRVAS